MSGSTYKVQVTRIQVIEEEIIAHTESEAIEKGLKKAIADSPLQSEWKTVSVDAKVLETVKAEPTVQDKDASVKTPPATVTESAATKVRTTQQEPKSTRVESSTTGTQKPETKNAAASKTRVPHPGSVLVLEFMGSRQNMSEISQKTGIPHKLLNKVVKGTADINLEIAESLGMSFGTGHQFWMNLQRQYDEAKK